MGAKGTLALGEDIPAQSTTRWGAGHVLTSLGSNCGGVQWEEFSSSLALTCPGSRPEIVLGVIGHRVASVGIARDRALVGGISDAH